MKDRLEIKGAIIGMVFGDASLSRERKNAHLRISHSPLQEEYLLWKKTILEKLTSVSVWRGEVTAFGKTYPTLRLWTKSHPLYTGLRDRFYHDGRKTFDLHLLKRLTDLGFFIWVMDEGSRNRVANGRHAMYLCTDRYNLVEHLSLQKFFHDRWGMTARITRRDNGRFRFRFGANELEKMEKLFAPFQQEMPDCMRYKLDPSYEAPSHDDGKRQSIG